MVEMAGLYFVIASLARARFVRMGQDDLPHTIQTVDPTNVIDAAAALNTRDPNQLAHVRFARLLAARISDDFAADVFTALVLIAPWPVLRELTARIDGPTRASLIGTSALDLVDVPDENLPRYLKKWIGPANVA
jgi:hypothetical protein